MSDDPTLREDVTYSSPSDCDVIVADDARQAITLMHERRPAVAIVEIHTGSAGGYGLTREMFEDPELTRIPVLMLIDRVQDGWLAEQAGAARWRTKPVDGALLVDEALALISA